MRSKTTLTDLVKWSSEATKSVTSEVLSKFPQAEPWPSQPVQAARAALAALAAALAAVQAALAAALAVAPAAPRWWCLQAKPWTPRVQIAKGSLKQRYACQIYANMSNIGANICKYDTMVKG